MKFVKLFLGLCILSVPTLSLAVTLPGTIETAKAVKAIYDRGFPLPHVVDVQFAHQTGTTISCVMVIYERKPNPVCPDDPMIGPNFDKGYAVCLSSSTKEVDSVVGVQTPDCE